MKFTAVALLGAILSCSVEARRTKNRKEIVSEEYAVCKLIAEDGSPYGRAKMMQAETSTGLRDIHWKSYIDQGLMADQDFDLDLWNARECGGDKKMSYEARARQLDTMSGLYVYSQLNGGISLSEIANVMSLGLLVDGAQVACCDIYSLDWKGDVKPYDPTDDATMLFKKIDTNGDGFVDMKEIMAVGATMDEAMMIIAALDKDMDKKISLKELLANIRYMKLLHPEFYDGNNSIDDIIIKDSTNFIQP